MTTFDNLSALKGYLTESIVESKMDEVVRSVIRDYIDINVYSDYMPTDYIRTFDLIDAVEIMKKSVGTKRYSFEVMIDSNELTLGSSNDSNWNVHASMSGEDVREYIPKWIEHGTSGSLWDRDGAHFAEDSHHDLSNGLLVGALRRALSRAGFKVIS